MKYVLHNLRSLIKNEKFIFAVMIVCVIASAWIMAFSYGLYQNYNVQLQEFSADNTDIDATVNEGETLTAGDFKRYLNAIDDEVKNEMYIYCKSPFPEFVYTGPDENGNVVEIIGGEASVPSIVFRFRIIDGAYHIFEQTKEAFEQQGSILSGRYISDEEEAEGALVAMVAGHKDPVTGTIKRNDETKALTNDDGTINIFGKKYTVIAEYQAGMPTPLIPFLSVPDEHEVSGVSLCFYKNVTRSQYDEITNTANEIIPGVLSFADMDIPDPETAYMYRNIMLIAALIAVITIVNFAVLFRYITAKRRRQNAIFRLCGCTVGKIMRASLAECCMICIPTFIIGIAAFIPVMELVLSNIFPYMKGAYSPVIYLAFVLIYTVLMLIIMSVVLFVQLRKMPVETLKRGGN